jgi:hypothetical protein
LRAARRSLPDLSAAVLDFGLGDGDTGALCEHLNARGIPFVVYTGYPQVGEACHKGIIVHKPAEGAKLIDTLSACLNSSPSSLGETVSGRDRPLRSAAGAPVGCGWAVLPSTRVSDGSSFDSP